MLFFHLQKLYFQFSECFDEIFITKKKTFQLNFLSDLHDAAPSTAISSRKWDYLGQSQKTPKIFYNKIFSSLQKYSTFLQSYNTSSTNS